MIVIITPEEWVQNETEWINELFREGLDLLHIRKPLMHWEEIKSFIQKIEPGFHHQLVLHGHYDLAGDFGISGFHFREADRRNNVHKAFADKVISTSVHDIETFNELDDEWAYAFFSPVFPSISKKGYGIDSTVLNDIKSRNNSKVKLIGLGGINENNIHEVLNSKADGVALLGAVWESEEPIKIFRKCRQNVLS